MVVSNAFFLRKLFNTGGINNNGSNNLTGVGSHLTRDQLLRQKFILDILQQVELPLQNQQLLELNIDGVLRENMYLGVRSSIER